MSKLPSCPAIPDGVVQTRRDGKEDIGEDSDPQRRERQGNWDHAKTPDKACQTASLSERQEAPFCTHDGDHRPFAGRSVRQQKDDGIECSYLFRDQSGPEVRFCQPVLLSGVYRSTQ